MDQSAISKAQERLRIAKTVLNRLATQTAYHDFPGEWYLFLVAAKNIYSKLEQGAKSSPQSRQWFGAKKKIRKQDELLEYLFIARDDAEHGINSGVKTVPGNVQFTIPKAKPGDETVSVRLQANQRGGVSVKKLDGTMVPSIGISPSWKLTTVTGRGGDTFDPPTHHLGREIPDKSPIGVATMAIFYLESLINEADSLS